MAKVVMDDPSDGFQQEDDAEDGGDCVSEGKSVEDLHGRWEDEDLDEEIVWESELGSGEELLMDQLCVHEDVSSPHLHMVEADYEQGNGASFEAQHGFDDVSGLPTSNSHDKPVGSSDQVSGLKQGGTLPSSSSSIPNSTFAASSSLSSSSSSHSGNDISGTNTRDERADRGILSTPVSIEHRPNNSIPRDGGTSTMGKQ